MRMLFIAFALQAAVFPAQLSYSQQSKWFSWYGGDETGAHFASIESPHGIFLVNCAPGIRGVWKGMGLSVATSDNINPIKDGKFIIEIIFDNKNQYNGIAVTTQYADEQAGAVTYTIRKTLENWDSFASDLKKNSVMLVTLYGGSNGEEKVQGVYSLKGSTMAISSLENGCQIGKYFP